MFREGFLSQMEMSFPIAIQENPAKLAKNITMPSAPKKCMGFRENRDMKPMVIKSKNPLMNRSKPNFDEPYLRA
jgi:hypothetical protein